MSSLKSSLKRYPLVVIIARPVMSFKRFLKDSKSGLLHGGELKVIKELGQFAPNTAGTYHGLEKEILGLTLLSASQTLPFMIRMCELLGKKEKEMVSSEAFCASLGGEDFAATIKTHFDAYNCDKALNHDYHYIYGPVIKKLGKVGALLEIGLGTVNTDVVSHMGKTWVPGASLRAFRDFIPDAPLYGADIDSRILFEEPRIKTYFVDQTKPETLTALGNKIPMKLDLIIDDGLHAPNANIAVLAFSIEKLNPGGWIVIEDIAEEAYPIWQIVSFLLPDQYKSYLIKAKGALVFAVEKPGKGS